MSPFHDNVHPLVALPVPPGTPRPRAFPGSVPLSSVQGTLALDLTPRLEPPQVSEVPGLPGGDVVGIDLRARRGFEQWAKKFAQATVEIVGGDRPVAQLLRWTTPRVYEDLTRRATLVARAGVHQAGQGRGRRPVVRPVVQNVRACFVSEACAEVSVHVRYGPRSRAIAGRFEVCEGRWQCNALEFG